MIKKSLSFFIIIIALLFPQPGYANLDHFENAMRLKADQKFNEALVELNLLIDRQPKNIPALEQKALMLGWTQRFIESIQIWRQLVNLVPSNLKFKVGLARVLFWNQELEISKYYLTEILKKDPQNKDALELAKVLFRARKIRPTTYRIDLGGVIDSFSAIRENESSTFLQAGMKVNSKIDAFFRYENQYQFKSTDQAIGLGAYYKFAPNWLFNADATETINSPNFRAKWITNFEIENSSLKPVAISIGYRGSIYQQGPVSTYQIGAALNLDSFTINYKYGLSQNIDFSITSSSQIKFSYNITEFTIVSIGYASGEEALPPLAKAKVAYLPIGIQHQFDDQHSFRLDYVNEDRVNTYNHQSFGLSYSYKF